MNESRIIQTLEDAQGTFFVASSRVGMTKKSHSKVSDVLHTED